MSEELKTMQQKISKILCFLHIKILKFLLHCFQCKMSRALKYSLKHLSHPCRMCQQHRYTCVRCSSLTAISCPFYMQVLLHNIIQGTTAAIYNFLQMELRVLEGVGPKVMLVVWHTPGSLLLICFDLIGYQCRW